MGEKWRKYYARVLDLVPFMGVLILSILILFHCLSWPYARTKIPPGLRQGRPITIESSIERIAYVDLNTIRAAMAKTLEGKISFLA